MLAVQSPAPRSISLLTHYIAFCTVICTIVRTSTLFDRLYNMLLGITGITLY